MRNFKYLLLLSLCMGYVQADTLDDALNYVGEQKYSVFYGGTSVHWVSDNTTNKSHNLIGVRVGNLAMGRFNNSFGRESYFIAAYGEKRYGDFNFFGVAGAVRGYTTCWGQDSSNTDICPMFAGGVSYLGVSRYLQPTVYQLGDASVVGVRADF